MIGLVSFSAYVAFTAAATPRVRPVVPMVDGRIVGGEDTTIEDFPHQVSLQYLNRHTCGASILTATKALTAAHCTEETPTNFLTIRAGTTRRNRGGTVAEIREIYQHPQYNPKTADYDVAVLDLAETLRFSSKIQPIPIHGSGEELATDTSATVTGWGVLCASGCINADYLQKVVVPKLSDRYCRAAYGQDRITDRMVCHGYALGGQDACQGDSGGPLISSGVQVGIVSWGQGCAAVDKPGVYTKIGNTEINEYIKDKLD